MLEEKLMKMLEKKKAKKIGPAEQKAKMGVLNELRDDMSSEMGDNLKGMMAKKVSVMAGNKEDLKKGLDKAKQLVGEMPNGEESEMESPAHEAAESVEEERSEHEEEELPELQGDELAEAALDDQIKELQKKLEKLKAKKGGSLKESEEE